MGIRGTARRLLARVRPPRPHPAILMYHRVATLESDPWDLAVAPELFEAQMAYLRQHRTPMAMDDLVESWKKGTPPAGAIGVTFDDGYLDNLVNAKPALVKHNVPATVFVATGFTGSGRPFWWDELAGMILTATAPVDRKITMRGQVVALCWGAREAEDGDPSWRGWDSPQTARQRCHVAAWEALQSASEAERAEALGVLREFLESPADPLGVPMTAAQVKEIVSGGLVRVGGHTVTHRALTDLDRSTCRAEIGDGGAQCQALTGEPVHGFAYPYGNFDPEVCHDVAQSAFRWACTTESRFLDAGPTDVFALPRITATNQPLRTFIQSISG